MKTKGAALLPGSAARRRAVATTVLAAVLCSLAWLAGSLVTADPAHAASKGIVDWRLEMPEGISDLSTVPAIVEEMGPGKLQARWTRVYARWARLQPVAPGETSAADVDGDGYDDAYVAELDAVIGAFRARGINVIVTCTDCPEWASDRQYWTGGYDSDVVMKIADVTVRAEFQRFARFLALRYGPFGVRHFEVWNEPNLNSGLDPQLVGAAKTPVGPAVYLKMLKTFYAGARLGNSKAVIIAGATSRRGANDDNSTSPQWFARYLKSKGAGRYFNAYSHHPYTPPGSNPRPSAPPRLPKTMVGLGNIDTLLKIFPTKPFYLTEYGYSTGTVDAFCVTVSEADQARYMRQAYALVARKSQIKVLLWFLVADWAPNPEKPESGIYSGLVGTDGLRKPGWYAFAGGNRLTLTGPASAAAGVSFDLSGSLTTRVGALADVTLTLQSRSPSGTTWSKVATTTTAADGSFAVTARQSKSRVYRVIWNGVCESKGKRVVMP